MTRLSEERQRLHMALAGILIAAFLTAFVVVVWNLSIVIARHAVQAPPLPKPMTCPAEGVDV